MDGGEGDIDPKEAPSHEWIRKVDGAQESDREENPEEGEKNGMMEREE